MEEDGRGLEMEDRRGRIWQMGMEDGGGWRGMEGWEMEEDGGGRRGTEGMEGWRREVKPQT
jgi:hypothetical protein